MKTTLLLLNLFMATTVAIAQDKQLLSETFDNNFREWPLREDNDFIRRIADGKMLMINKSKRYHWCGRSVETNKKSDLKIETIFNFTKFQKGNAGIFWGGDEDYKKMNFFIVSPDGTFQFGEWAPEFESKTGSTKHEAINKGAGAINKITMLKKGGKAKFLVNDVEVYSTSFPRSYGKQIGLIMGGGALAAETDYFTVAELEKTDD